MKIVRAAVVQDAPVAFGREQTLEKVRALTASAAQAGAQLVVFPEAFVSAYPKGIDFGARHGDDPEAVMIRGGSCIVNPFGEILAGPSYDAPCIPTADLDLDDVVRGKYDLDVVGPYARPDIFRLHVNERATRTLRDEFEKVAWHNKRHLTQIEDALARSPVPPSM